MKTKLSILSIILFTAFGASAQPGGGKPDDIEKIRTRKLIVVTEVPDEKVVKDVTKRKETKTLEEYKSMLQQYNENMKAVAEKFWPWATNGIEYKSRAETAQLRKDKSKDYAVLYCFLRSVSMMDVTQVYKDEGMNKNAYLSRDDFNKLFKDNNCQMEVCLVEDYGRNYPVGAVRLADIVPTKLDLVLGINTIQQYFNSKAPDKKAGGKKATDYETSRKSVGKMDVTKLKDKTLMIRKDHLGENLTEAVVGQHYPYAFKICTKEELDEMCMNDKIPANSALILNFPTDDPAFGQNNNQHSNICAYDINSFVALSIVAENFTELNEKNLKNFTKK